MEEEGAVVAAAEWIIHLSMLHTLLLMSFSPLITKIYINLSTYNTDAHFARRFYGTRNFTVHYDSAPKDSLLFLLPSMK